MARGAEVSLRDADHALREIREALEHPGHFPTRKDREAALARLDAARKHLYPLLQQLREDAEWKRWVNTTVQEELCAKAEALLAEEDLERAANTLRELDAGWKQAKEAPKDQAEALWTRFKAARDQVKSRTDAFFAKQAEELAGNLKKKEALCEKAAGLAESSDWLKTAEELRQLQAEWKEIGPVPRAVSQRVWERFRKPCDHFFTRWQEHRNLRSHEWADNLAKKEALCEKAEALRESTDWEAGSAEIKRLQAEWRTIGAVKKTRSEAIWQRFRAACDHFFDRYKNRDEHARQAAQDAREGICAELEALLPAEGETSEPPADLVARLSGGPDGVAAGGQPAPRPDGRARRAVLRGARPAPADLPPRLRGQRPRPGGEPPQGREARRPRRGPPRGAGTGRRGAPAAERGGARRAAARRARLEHDRRPRGGRGEVALGLGRGRVGAGGLEAPRPRAGGGGPRPLGPLRAGLPPLLRAAAETEAGAGAAARRRVAAGRRAGPSPALRPAGPALVRIIHEAAPSSE